MRSRGGLRIDILRARCVVGECLAYVGVGFLDRRLSWTAMAARHATGGSIPGLLPRSSDTQLNVTQSINNTGNVRPLPPYIRYMFCLLLIGPRHICLLFLTDVREILDPRR
jgi:hypothetical protein